MPPKSEPAARTAGRIPTFSRARWASGHMARDVSTDGGSSRRSWTVT